MSEQTFELADGKIIVTYVDDEVVGVDDWNGNDVTESWFKIAQEKLDEMLDSGPKDAA